MFDFTPKAKIDAILRGRTLSGSMTVSGPPREQIREIASVWTRFGASALSESLITEKNLWVAMENFIFSPDNTYGGESAIISTSLIWGFEAYRMGRADERRSRGKEIIMPPMILQMASEAKGFASKARLRDWDMWTVGREHERSAWAHVALLAKRIQIQGVAG